MTDIQEQLVPPPSNTPVVENIPANNPPAETEPAPPTEPAQPDPPQEDPKFAQRFAALSRKEKELIQRERQFKEQQAQLTAYQKAINEAKQNPLSLVQAAGFKDLTEYLQAVVNGPEAIDPNDPNHKIKTIEQKIAEYENAVKENQKRQQEFALQQQVASFKANIFEFVKQNSEQYELIMEHKAIDDVFNVIYQAYQDTGGQINLTIEEAAKAVEEQLLKEEEEHIARATKLNKLKSKFPHLSNEETVKVSNQDKVSKIAPTLTNQSVSPTTEPKKFKSREESLKEAAKLLKWK